MVPFSAISMFLSGLVTHAFPVQLTVGARVRLVARRQEVGGNVALGGNEGDNLDLFLDLGEGGEELRLGIALKDVCCDGVTGLMRRCQPGGICLVKEHLRLEDICRLPRDIGLRAQSKIKQHRHRGPALHVRQQFKGKLLADLFDRGLAQDDLFQELCLDAGGAGRAGQRIVDEKIQRVGPVRMVRRLDLRDDLGKQGTIVDGLGVQPLVLACFDLFKVASIEGHWLIR